MPLGHTWAIPPISKLRPPLRKANIGPGVPSCLATLGWSHIAWTQQQ